MSQRLIMQQATAVHLAPQPCVAAWREKLHKQQAIKLNPVAKAQLLQRVTSPALH